MISVPPIKVGLTGGIGSGKSIVARLFRMLGVSVYDTDAQAKRLMACDVQIAASIKARFGEGVFRDGKPDRASLAAVVFCNSDALADLEGIIHPAVTKDFLSWAAVNGGSAGYVVAESAILFDSGMNAFMDFNVAVSAPEELRIERASQRDGVSPEKIKERMAHQMTDARREESADYIIHNDEQSLVWEQVSALDIIFRRKATDRL